MTCVSVFPGLCVILSAGCKVKLPVKNFIYTRDNHILYIHQCISCCFVPVMWSQVEKWLLLHVAFDSGSMKGGHGVWTGKFYTVNHFLYSDIGSIFLPTADEQNNVLWPVTLKNQFPFVNCEVRLPGDSNQEPSWGDSVNQHESINLLLPTRFIVGQTCDKFFVCTSLVTHENMFVSLGLYKHTGDIFFLAKHL